LRTEPATAHAILDHDRRFLTYQGPVQNGQGRVTIADRGRYTTVSQTSDRWRIDLQGEVLAGRFMLEIREDGGWSFSWEDRSQEIGDRR
jgi:hypothetical protein